MSETGLPHAEDLLFSRLLLPAVTRFPGKPIVIDGDFTGTYSQHFDRVVRIVNGMRSEFGLLEDDRFAVLALNSHYYLELYHAALLGGGIITPLNLRLAGSDLRYVIADCGAKLVFVDTAFADHYARNITEINSDHALPKVVLMGEHADVPHDFILDEIVSSADPAPLPEIAETQPVILMYTGGTTGRSRGVLIDSRGVMHATQKLLLRAHWTDSCVFLLQTPMFHTASLPGITCVPGLGGTTTMAPLFDAARTLDILERDQATATIMVPTMIQIMLDDPSFHPARLSSLESLGYGASPMPVPLLERLKSVLPHVDLAQVYGLTESTGGVVTWLGPDEHRAGGPLLRSAGRPLPGNAISIQDLAGNPVPTGEPGEICVRSGALMKGYWERPDDTALAFKGGWFHTGDVGYLDERGYLYITDRLKDMIVTGGENVYSIEVEDAIASHPAVSQVAVIGIPSEKWGEQVHAVVVLKPDDSASAEELQDWARDRIAAYKVPKTIEFQNDPLPLSGALKVLKRELRSRYWERA